MYNLQIVITEWIILHVMAKKDEKMFRSCEECDNFTENQIKCLLGKIVDNIVLTLLHTCGKKNMQFAWQNDKFKQINGSEIWTFCFEKEIQELSQSEREKL